MLKVELVNEKEIIDITPLVEKVEWSGDYKQVSRIVEMSIISSPMDKNIPKVNIELGNVLKLYWESKEIFRGYIFKRSAQHQSSVLKIKAYDRLIYLLRNQDTYNFKQKKPEEISKEICNKWGIPVESIITTNVKFDRKFLDSNLYEIMQTAYTIASNTTKKKYFISMNKDKLIIDEVGKVTLEVTFQNKANLLDSTFSEDIESMVNKVVVVDADGKFIKEIKDSNNEKLYGTMQAIIKSEEGKDMDAAAQSELKGVNREATLKGFGDPTCVVGRGVNVKDPHTGLVGLFYIIKDKHVWEKNTYSIELGLSFEKMMDELSSGSEDKEETSSSSNCTCGAQSGISGGDSNIDWGHGITASQLNNVLKGALAGQGDTFIKLSNAYKVNPALMASIAIHETGNGTSSAVKNKNNPFGFMDPSTNWSKLKTFNSLADGLKAGISNLSRNYIYSGRKSIEQIGAKYAPVGASNDPNGLNKNWVPSVKSFYKKITGVNYSSSKSGTGVKSEISISVSGSGKTCTCSSSSSSSSSSSGTTSSGNSKVDNVIAKAKSKLGKPYVWGATGPNSFDCSGLMYWSYKQGAGITLPRTSKEQAKYGTSVSKANLRPGDLIFFDTAGKGTVSHVGMVVGNGQMIHAPHSGDVVKIVSYNTNYYNSKYKGARRIIN